MYKTSKYQTERIQLELNWPQTSRQSSIVDRGIHCRVGRSSCPFDCICSHHRRPRLPFDTLPLDGGCPHHSSWSTAAQTVSWCIYTQPSDKLCIWIIAHTHKPPHFLQQSYLWPGRVLPATRVTVSMATFLVLRFALTATVAVVDLLVFTICAADFGAVYFQGAISQAALSCALTLTSHVPPASRENPRQCFYMKWRKNWLVHIL